MDAGEQAPTIVYKSSILRSVLFLIIGILIGALLMGASLYMFGTSATGKAFLANYYASHALAQVSTNVETPAAGSDVPPPAATSSSVILVPKAYAGEAYYEAINAAVASFNAIQEKNQQLVPILVQISSQSSGGNFSNILNLITQAKALIAQEETLNNQFSTNLSALTTANQTTTDTDTRTLTQSFISEGTQLEAKLGDFLTSLDALFSGPPPTAGQIADITAKSNAVATQDKATLATAQALLSHFAAVGH